MRLAEIEARLAELALEIRSEGSDLDALETEVRALQEERKTILDQAEKRKSLLAEVALSDKVLVIAQKDESEERNKMDKVYNAASPEYRSAFFKNLIGAEMGVEERAAFTHTTLNSPAVLPTTTLNEIWDLVSKQHVIMGDVKTYRTGTVLEVIVHRAIVQGKAKVVAEGVANDDEQNTFVTVSLAGKDFSKHVEISYAAATMSVEALEDYLKTEIALNIGEALADDTIATIKSGVAVANKVNTAAVKKLAFTDVTGAFALLQKVAERVVYVNNATFYNYIVSMVDTTGRPLFQPSLQDGAQGVLLGARVKIEESVSDNEIFVGDPQKVICNVVTDILIEQDKDIKTHKHIYAGYARAESALVNDTSFTILTVKQA